MSKIVEEFIKLNLDFKNLKRKYELQGQKNNDLFHKNQELVSENLILKELICEKYEIIPEVLYANIKLYRKEKQVKDTNIRIKKIKEHFKVR